MTGSVELDPDGRNLLIRFPYREDLVALVKDLPGRRWDPKDKLWRVPAAHVEAVFAALSRHLFDFAPEIPSLLAGTLGTVPASPSKATRGKSHQATLALPTLADDSAEPAPALTISALNKRVRDGLRQQFPDAFWVVGEVVDYDKSSGRSHRFFQLVEKAKDQARATAAVEVALFASTAERLLPRLLGGETPLSLRDGIEVRALVRVDLYAATGRFQVIIEDIDPSFTLGKLALTREQILRELAQKGLLERNRSLGLPVPALRVGVLASPDSDGWSDFLHHVEESSVGFTVALVPITVQGIEMKPSLLQGLAWFARHADDFDVLCIVRGGGSRTDLAWFDDRDLAFAVARHPLKVLVGIGHQRDQSVLDSIAHSEKTPTAVAELLVRCAEAARLDAEVRIGRLLDGVTHHLHRLRTMLDQRARELQRAADLRLSRFRATLAAAGREVTARTRLRLQYEHAALHEAAARTRHATRRQLDHTTARLEQHATRHRLLDPRRVLGRGYALVRSIDGRVLPAVARLQPDQSIRLQFRDGHADGRIDHVHPDSP